MVLYYTMIMLLLSLGVHEVFEKRSSCLLGIASIFLYSQDNTQFVLQTYHKIPGPDNVLLETLDPERYA